MVFHTKQWNSNVTYVLYVCSSLCTWYSLWNFKRPGEIAGLISKYVLVSTVRCPSYLRMWAIRERLIVYAKPLPPEDMFCSAFSSGTHDLDQFHALVAYAARLHYERSKCEEVDKYHIFLRRTKGTLNPIPGAIF